MSKQNGFTLIEVMIVVAIVAILASVAIPAYSDYIQRAKIAEATQTLSDMRTRMEQFFLDNRSYQAPGGGCGVADVTLEHFQYTCVSNSTTTYVLQATGLGAKGMGGFTFTLNEANVKGSDVTKSGWDMGAPCWQFKKGGC